MKKILVLGFILFTLPVRAYQLEGGIKYNVDSAREYVQEAQENHISIIGHATFDKNDKNIGKIVYSYNTQGLVIGVTIQYKDEPNMAYIYVNNKLKYVDKYDKNIDIYPHRGYRYTLAGELDLMSLSVSKNESFRFSPDGRLIAHSINGIIYDENGNIIGTAK